MARTVITAVTALVFNAGIVTPAGQTIDQVNGMTIPGIVLEPEAIPANKGADLLVLEVFNTAGSPLNLIIRQGAALLAGFTLSPWPAFRGLLGDLTIAVTNSSTIPFKCGPFETSRFKQFDGSLSIDFGAGFTGTINAFLLPKAPFVA